MSHSVAQAPNRAEPGSVATNSNAPLETRTAVQGVRRKMNLTSLGDSTPFLNHGHLLLTQPNVGSPIVVAYLATSPASLATANRLPQLHAAQSPHAPRWSPGGSAPRGGAQGSLAPGAPYMFQLERYYAYSGALTYGPLKQRKYGGCQNFLFPSAS